jgi:1-phosphatidylinositol phosphodiesterase
MGSHLPQWEFVNQWVDCQDWSLADQLNHGIRYVDIRCRHIQDVFAIHHDAFYMGINFGAGVRDVCISFLTANPTECIIMQIKEEYTASDNTQTFQQVFDGYVQGFESSFYLDDHIPRLPERGIGLLSGQWGTYKT